MAWDVPLIKARGQYGSGCPSKQGTGGNTARDVLLMKYNKRCPSNQDMVGNIAGDIPLLNAKSCTCIYVTGQP